MRTSVAVLLMTVFTMMNSAEAVQMACDESCRHKKSLQEMAKYVEDHARNGRQDRGCPKGGKQVRETRTVLEGSLFSAEGIVKQINQSNKREAQPLRMDQSKCGSCEQINVVSETTVSRPKTSKYVARCETYPTQNVRGEFNSEMDAAKYAEAVLKQRNNDGDRLYAGCPDPCSFYIYNALTPLSNGKVRLNLTVRCGQPREGLMSKYVFSGALVQEWTCAKR